MFGSKCTSTRACQFASKLGRHGSVPQQLVACFRLWRQPCRRFVMCSRMRTSCSSCLTVIRPGHFDMAPVLLTLSGIALHAAIMLPTLAGLLQTSTALSPVLQMRGAHRAGGPGRCDAAGVRAALAGLPAPAKRDEPPGRRCGAAAHAAPRAARCGRPPRTVGGRWGRAAGCAVTTGCAVAGRCRAEACGAVLSL